MILFLIDLLHATMLYSAKNYDISDLVIKRINRQQKIQNRKEQIEGFKI